MTDNNQLTPQSPNALFFPAEADKNIKSAVRRFIRWLDERGLGWATVDLKDYRDYLASDKSGLSIVSAKKHLEHVRGRYADMLHSNEVRNMIQARIPEDATPADAYAITEEFLTRLSNNTQYDKRLAIPLPKKSVYLDSKAHWLSADEIRQLIERVPRTSKLGYRDAAILALCYTYGLREAEACAATVADIRETVKGKSGLHVPLGKGMKERFVQLVPETDYRAYVYDWLAVAGIEIGAILAGVKPRQLQNRVKLYGTLSPHDLRRSYAKNLHNAGYSIEFIGQQLGHSKLETTLIYLGMIESGKD
jgi:site-specific recombinase XerD